MKKVVGLIYRYEGFIFWFFWLLCLWPYLGRGLNRYFEGSRGSYFLLFVLYIAVGIFIQTILNRKSFSSLKAAVLGLQGFVAFPTFFLLFGIIFVLLILNGIFHIEPNVYVLGIALGSLFLTGSFLGGCWLGYRLQRMIVVWLVAGFILFLVFTSSDGYLFGLAKSGLLGFIAFAPAIVGAYIGIKYLSEKPPPVEA